MDNLVSFYIVGIHSAGPLGVMEERFWEGEMA